MNKPPATPIVLASLAKWEAKRIDQTVERIRLALAAGHPDRAYRVLSAFERESFESPPVESVMSERAANLLRRRGVTTLADLEAAREQLPQWSEISVRLRAEILMTLH